MMFLKIVIIFLFIFIFFNLRNFLKFNRNQKVLNAKKLTTFNKKNLYNWMNLTKKERYNLSKQDSVNYMDRSCLLYTSPSPRDNTTSRMPSSA